MLAVKQQYPVVKSEAADPLASERDEGKRVRGPLLTIRLLCQVMGDGQLLLLSCSPQPMAGQRACFPFFLQAAARRRSGACGFWLTFGDVSSACPYLLLSIPNMSVVLGRHSICRLHVCMVTRSAGIELSDSEAD